MLPKGEKCRSFITDADEQLQEVAAVNSIESNSVRSKEEEDQVPDHTYKLPITYSFTIHQGRDYTPAEDKYHAGWFTREYTSLGTQYSYQNTSILPTDSDIDGASTVEQAPMSHWQTQTKPGPARINNLNFQSSLGVKEDFLHTGAQFYGQSEHSQKEHATYQRTDLAPSKNGEDTLRFDLAEDCDYVLLSPPESMNTCQVSENWELVDLGEPKL